MVPYAPAQAAGCDLDEFLDGTVRVGTVRGGAARVHFVTESRWQPGCLNGPNATAACRLQNDYVVPGDVVLLAGMRGAYTCAAVAGARGYVTEWLPSAAVAPGPGRTPRLDEWVGHWTAPERNAPSSIDITRSTVGDLVLKGDASWGVGDPQRVRNGGIHVGRFAAETRPVGSTVAFTEGWNPKTDSPKTLPYDVPEGLGVGLCRVRMALHGPYLVVRDSYPNDGGPGIVCGGVNIALTGIYRRR